MAILRIRRQENSAYTIDINIADKTTIYYFRNIQELKRAQELKSVPELKGMLESKGFPQ